MQTDRNNRLDVLPVRGGEQYLHQIFEPLDYAVEALRDPPRRLRKSNHTLWSENQKSWECDFCTKPMWIARGLVDVYLLVSLHLGTIRVWISRCTARPDLAWVSLLARNFEKVANAVQRNEIIFPTRLDGFLKSYSRRAA